MSDLFLSSSNPFVGFKTDWILGYVKAVTTLLEQHKPNYVFPVNKKTGKQTRPALMHWMVPLWERGLALAKAELERRSVA